MPATSRMGLRFVQESMQNRGVITQLRAVPGHHSRAESRGSASEIRIALRSTSEQHQEAGFSPGLPQVVGHTCSNLTSVQTAPPRLPHTLGMAFAFGPLPAQ